MKKFISVLIMTAILTIMIPLSVAAQTYYVKHYDSNGRVYYTRAYKKQSYYRRHRKLVQTAAGTGAGLIVGGLIGGRRGAGIGALAGAGGGLLYHHAKHYNRRY